MLGITTPDAIAFGSVCAALLAAFAGLVKGDQAKKDSPPDPAMAMIGWGLLDREALRDLTGAVTDLVDALRAGISSNERISRDATTGRLDEISHKSDETSAHMKELLKKIEEMGKAQRGP